MLRRAFENDAEVMILNKDAAADIPKIDCQGLEELRDICTISLNSASIKSKKHFFVVVRINFWFAIILL